MAKVHKTITIKAPVEKVFAFMNDPHNLPVIWPSMVEVKNVSPMPTGGYKFEWVYKMAGMRIDGASETTEYIPNQRIATRSTKGIESHFSWVFEPVAKGTLLSVDIEYSVPVPVLGKLAESIIVKQNEREADVLLENLKKRMEIEAPIAA